LQRIPALDGLRGIAVILVCLYHFSGFSVGWAGVDLFFVLSGFLITTVLMEAKGQPNYFRNFFVRRALRILPLYYLLVGVFFLPFLWIAHRHGRWINVPSQLWYWFHLSNWSSAFGPMVRSPLGHVWSLAVEEQFYLIWPFVVLLLCRRTLRNVCIGIIISVLLLRCGMSLTGMWRTYPELMYRLTPFRIDTLAFGTLIATFRSKRDPRIPGLLGCALLVAVLSFSTSYKDVRMFTVGFTAIGLIGFSLVLYAKQSNPGWLCFPLLQSFGKYSYAIYMFHVPVRFALYWFVLPKIHSAPLGILISTALGLPASYAIAWLSWRVIETPFLNLKDRLTVSRIPAFEENLAAPLV
jgi:peptidoglycan/LPS O-acetylase OafA/YrhL